MKRLACKGIIVGCWMRFETEVPGLRGQITTTSKFMCQALAVCHNFSSDKGLAKRQPFPLVMIATQPLYT